VNYRKRNPTNPISLQVCAGLVKPAENSCSHYRSVAAFAFRLWEYLRCFTDEVEYIWRYEILQPTMNSFKTVTPSPMIIQNLQWEIQLHQGTLFHCMLWASSCSGVRFNSYTQRSPFNRDFLEQARLQIMQCVSKPLTA
jgi:hypothetical protein